MLPSDRIHTPFRKLTIKKTKSVDTRRYSRIVVDGVKQTPSRAMLRAVGFGDADFEKPQVGIASTWSNLTPCNMHIDELARLAAGGVEAARRQGDHLQHHHRFRRHLDGHARHALFAWCRARSSRTPSKRWSARRASTASWPSAAAIRTCRVA